MTLFGTSAKWIDAINKGAVPVISSAWQSVVQLEGRRALDDAIGQYRAGCGGSSAGSCTPCTKEKEKTSEIQT